jgi:hypothetical protein
MTDTNPDTLLDIITRTSKRTNEDMKSIRDDIIQLWGNISDKDIREFYKAKGEYMFEPIEKILNNFKNSIIPNNLESIANLRRINRLTHDKKQKLNESEELEKESLKIINEIQDIIKNMMLHRVNKAKIATLEDITRDVIMINKVQPRNKIEEVVHKQPYSKGGVRNSRKSKNNKKYTKKRTYEIRGKYVSNKNKTRNIQKNYL